MKKFAFLISSFLFLVTSLLFLASPAHAVITNPVLKNATTPSTNPKAYFNSVFSAVISIFFLVAIIYYVWHIVFAGYHLIASEGDPKRWDTGKNEMVYATVGLIVVFSIFAILKFVGAVVGIPGLESLTIAWPTL